MTTPSDDPTLQRVLIVEDDPSIRALVKLIFERADFIVDSAVDGQEALDKLAGDTHYAVVVLDLTMPKRSGFDVIETLKREPPEGLKGVVVMTALNRELRESDRALVCGIVRKPFDVGDLKKRVQACIDRSTSEDLPDNA